MAACHHWPTNMQKCTKNQQFASSCCWWQPWQCWVCLFSYSLCSLMAWKLSSSWVHQLVGDCASTTVICSRVGVGSQLAEAIAAASLKVILPACYQCPCLAQSDSLIVTVCWFVFSSSFWFCFSMPFNSAFSHMGPPWILQITHGSLFASTFSHAVPDTWDNKTTELLDFFLLSHLSRRQPFILQFFSVSGVDYLLTPLPSHLHMHT